MDVLKWFNTSDGKLQLGSKQEQFEILTQSLALNQKSRTLPAMTHASLVVCILQHTTISS